MPDTEYLKSQRALHYKNMKSSHNLLLRVHQVCESIKARYRRDKNAYEEADRKLAELDGRLVKVEPQTSGKRKQLEKLAADAYIEKFLAADPEEQASMLARLQEMQKEAV